MLDAVPFMDLVAQQREISQGVEEDVLTLLRTAAFVGGAEVGAFEDEYAAFVGVTHCVGLANGTDAVELSLRAVGVGPGDEVIVPANTFIATVEAVLRTGATPVLVDVDEEHLLIDPEAVAAAVTTRTSAVVPVHLYGQTAPVEAVQLAAAGIPVVEDAAQSQGASRHGVMAGALGLVAATSFYPGKNLGAMGDAGAATTNDASIARRLRLLGNHGSERKYDHEVLGFNSRLDAVQAVQLRHKLRRLTDWNTQRDLAAKRYSALLAARESVRLPATMPGNQHVWHLYVVRVQDRDAVLTRLLADGIGAALHYPVPVHLTPAMRGRGLGQPGQFPVSEQAAQSLLSLPMFPHITEGQQERVSECLLRALTT